MARKIQLRVGFRKNTNTTSVAYGKWYPEVVLRQKLGFKEFCDHIQSHGLAFPREYIEAIVAQIMQCLPELVLQGVSVKIDGLGIFYPSIEGGGCDPEILKAGTDFSVNVHAVHMRFRPDSSEANNLTAPANLDKASIENYGCFQNIEIKNNAGDEPMTVDDAVLIPFDVWKKQYEE